MSVGLNNRIAVETVGKRIKDVQMMLILNMGVLIKNRGSRIKRIRCRNKPGTIDSEQMIPMEGTGSGKSRETSVREAAKNILKSSERYLFALLSKGGSSGHM